MRHSTIYKQKTLLTGSSPHPLLSSCRALVNDDRKQHKLHVLVQIRCSVKCAVVSVAIA